MRTSMVILFVGLAALVAAPFILKAGKEVANRLGELWKDEVIDEESDDQPEIEKGDDDVTH